MILHTFINAIAREMAQQIETLSALSENQVHFPIPTEQLTTVCNSGSEGSNNHFSPRWAPDTHRCNGYIWLKDSHKTDTSENIGVCVTDIRERSLQTIRIRNTTGFHSLKG